MTECVVRRYQCQLSVSGASHVYIAVVRKYDRRKEKWVPIKFYFTPPYSVPSFVSLFVFLSDDESDPEASEFDLGTKIKTPKDVMLEELSLLNNKGSKMFRMRQQRVEKFIVTNENQVGLKKSNGGCVCVQTFCAYVCTNQTISFLFCLPAEPWEPADVPASCSAKAKSRRWVTFPVLCGLSVV